jgi:hypothetical protein
MVLILVIASPPLMTDGAVCDVRVRLHGLDLSTKHVVSDTREPEMKKPRRIARLYIFGRLVRRYDRGTVP